MNKLFLFLLAVPHNAFAQYYNSDGGFYNPPGTVGGFRQGLGSILNGWLGEGHTGGYYAGQQDAIYDHDQVWSTILTRNVATRNFTDMHSKKDTISNGTLISRLTNTQTST